MAFGSEAGSVLDAATVRLDASLTATSAASSCSPQSIAGAAEVGSASVSKSRTSGGTVGSRVSRGSRTSRGKSVPESSRRGSSISSRYRAALDGSGSLIEGHGHAKGASHRRANWRRGKKCHNYVRRPLSVKGNLEFFRYLGG